MMWHSKLGATISVLSLVAVSAVSAQESKPASGMAPPPAQSSTPAPKEAAAPKDKMAAAKPARTKVFMGTVRSVNDTQLVLSRKGKDGKSEETTFVLNGATQKKGMLKEGARATVNYRVENNENIATSVRPTGMHRTAAVTTKPKGK